MNDVDGETYQRLILRQPEKADAPLAGLLVATWFLAFLALFGPEAHSLIYQRNDDGFAFALLGLWVAAPLLMRELLLHRLHHPAVPQTSGRSIRRPLQTVHPAIATYVLDRAKAIGIEDVVRVVRHPNSGRTVNGYVWSRRGTQYLCVTSKVETLYGAGRRGDAAAADAFRFLVDHELGHIFHRDTGAFLLARGILLCTLPLLPLKLGVAYVLNWRYAVFDFARSLPILTDGSGAVSGLTLPTIAAGTTAYLAFTAASIATLFLVYYTLKRRREFLADRFAFLQAPDPTAATAALRKLTDRSASPAYAVPQGFLGGSASHPDVEARARRMMRSAGDRRRDIELIVTTVAAIVLGRIALAEHESVTWKTLHGAEKVGFSIVYISLASLLVASAIAAPREVGEAARHLVWLNLAELVLFAAMAALALATVLFLCWRAAGPAADPAGALLRWVELVEAVILVASLPVVVAVLGACHAAIGRLRLLRPGPKAVLATTVGVLIIWSIAIASGPLDRWRDAQNESVRSIVYDELEAAIICRGDVERSDRERESCEAQAEWYAELGGLIDTQFRNQNFRPPLSWIFLWQQSFQRPGRTA